MAGILPLFGNQDAASVSKALVEFRAGKMRMESSSNLVTPDKRKGMVQIEKGEDQLMHFKWKDRKSGVVEDDLIIFPDDIEFTRVTQCTTGRVFVLKFKSSRSRRMFFWMQEPKEDKDEDFCQKVNDFLNKPPSDGVDKSKDRRDGALAALGGSDGGLDLSSLGDSELQSYLGNMNQQQLMQLFGGANGLSNLAGSGLFPSGPSTSSNRTVSESNSTTTAGMGTGSADKSPTTEAVNATPSSKSLPQDGTGAVQLSELQSILSGIKVPAKEKKPAVDLALGFTGEAVAPLLNNPEFVAKMKTLLPSVEEGDVANELSSTISSPPFQQALTVFSSGLQSGQLAPLIREFNLGDAAIAAATAGDMEAFIKAIEKKKPEKDEATEGEDANMKDA